VAPTAEKRCKARAPDDDSRSAHTPLIRPWGRHQTRAFPPASRKISFECLVPVRLAAVCTVERSLHRHQGVSSGGWPMCKTQLAMCMMVVGVSACAPPPTSTETEQTSAVTVTAAMPPGDARAGRQAFLDLRCTACHEVPFESEFPPPVSANLGPPIDARLAGKDVSYLATAIVSPSHQISLDTSPDVRGRLEGILSPMGDFSQAMTVRQFVDVHAFIRSVK